MKRVLTLIFPLALLCGGLGAQGVMTTFAGTDLVFNGDGKAALSVAFNVLGGISLDPGGNPVVVDSYNGVVVRLNRDGTLSVLAGNAVMLARRCDQEFERSVSPLDQIHAV